MSDVVNETKPRGRPRKALEDVPPVTAQHLEANVAIRQNAAAKALKGGVVEHWYQLKPGSKPGVVKVCKCTRHADGNVHSVYLGRESQMLEDVKKWKAAGLVRV